MKSRVLVVEDERLLSEMLVDILTENGFEVDVAGNARQALERLQRGTACDVLFTDIDLGSGPDGAQLSVAARQIRPDLPVVYSSGSVASLRELKAVQGARFVAKPYDFERLCALLREAAGQLTPA